MTAENGYFAKKDSCPAHEALAAFSRGDMTEGASEALVEHLATCTTCQRALRHLEELECPFLATLKTPAPDDPILREPECRRLEEAARAIADEAGSVHPLKQSFFQTFPNLKGFECIDFLGQGPTGKVYQAQKPDSENHLAIKAIPMPMPLSNRTKERFCYEVRLAAKLTNGLVPDVLEIKETDGFLLLVTPFLAGVSLSQIIAGRKVFLSGKRAAAIHPFVELSDSDYVRAMLTVIGKVVAAVGCIHEAKLLHGTLTPSNVFLECNKSVRILDFGLPRLTGIWGEVRLSGFDQFPADLGGQGRSEDFQVGHVGFVTPEEWDGHTRLDQRADVFQLGVTAYQALTLKLPFGISPVTSRSAAPAAPSALQPTLSPSIDAVLSRALAPDRDQRYRSAAEFSQDWRQAEAQACSVQSRVSTSQSKRLASVVAFVRDLLHRFRGTSR